MQIMASHTGFQKMSMKRILLFLVLQGILSWHISYAGGEPWRSDTLMLPQYCKDRVQSKKDFEKKWRSTFGEALIHIHHYCGGIYAEKKARIATDKGVRERLLGEVIHQMGYVSNHCNEHCVLYPELQTRWAWALGESGQVGEAIKHYQLAIQAKPKYTPAYARLSELYLELKKPEEARKILQQGLTASPKSSMLKRRLEELASSG